jgi:hypothetical protein
MAPDDTNLCTGPNGHKRYIFKVGEIYVAGIMIAGHVIASYIESFLNEKK